MTTMWSGGDSYDQLMGRWSGTLAPLFVEFAEPTNGDKVLEVGCGTGSLTRVLLEHLPGSEVVGVDPAATYVEYLGQRLTDPRLLLDVGDAQDLPFEANTFDQCLSLLVFNFIPDARKALVEMSRVTRSGGTVAVGVWD